MSAVDQIGLDLDEAEGLTLVLHDGGQQPVSVSAGWKASAVGITGEVGGVARFFPFTSIQSISGTLDE